MATRKAIDWAQGRALFATGKSYAAIGAALGCDKAYVIRTAKAQEWKRDAEAEIAQRVTEKVTGVVTDAVTGDAAKKRERAIELEASRRAEVLAKHQAEWGKARDRLLTALDANMNAKGLKEKAIAFADLKAAKISAEAMAIIQGGERKAHRLDEPPGMNPNLPPPPPPTLRVLWETQGLTGAPAAPDEGEDE